MRVSFLRKQFGAMICVVVMMQPSCLRDSYRVQLSGPVEIGGDWIELRPQSPLKAEKTFQWVLLNLEPPLKNDTLGEGKGPDSGLGILLPDGEVINPEVELIDQHGNKFNLVYKGARGGPIYGHTPPGGLPRDREYKAVRIRSARPIKCTAIYWYCESSKDWL